jgi:predicted nucleic acid-binding protein
MFSYLDTSSLVKLYVEEDESDFVYDLVRSSEITATSIVAYAEARAAFARRFREKSLTRKEYIRLKAVFDEDWSNYFILNLTGNMVKMAGDLADKHSLRGFDSIHLASALTLRQELNSDVIFSCFDNNLQKASEHEGLVQE